MKKTQLSAASVALASLLAGAAGAALPEAKAADHLGTGAEVRGALLQSATSGQTLGEDATPTPTPEGKKGGEGKCGEGKCGDGGK
jgi:hypothetical protein